MSWRRLSVLVKKLIADPTSLTAHASGGPACTVDQFLLADLREAAAGVKNPWREALNKKARSARAHELVARQEAWNKRLRG